MSSLQLPQALLWVKLKNINNFGPFPLSVSLQLCLGPCHCLPLEGLMVLAFSHLSGDIFPSADIWVCCPIDPR